MNWEKVVEIFSTSLQHSEAYTDWGTKLQDAMQFVIDELGKTAYLKEGRDDSGDYPGTTHYCSHCSNEVSTEDNYCSNCGSKFTGKIVHLPDTKCRLCKYTCTGYKEDCFYKKLNSARSDCKYDDYPHWIEHKNADESEGRLLSNFECSYCHGRFRDKTKYCPDCGNKM